MTAYLEGEHQPVTREVDVASLRVTGALPSGLEGMYVRNSGNPRFAPKGKYHWFDGDGMVHGIRFGSGGARYMNRWIQTRALKHEEQAGHALWSGILEPMSEERMLLPGGPIKDTANTDLVFHRGQLYALWWLSGLPYELSTKDLSTVGPQKFGGKLKGGFSAHPKVDPRTGELVFFDYSIVREPHLRYGLVDASGELIRYEAIEIPTPHILHDMAITENYSVLMDFPLGWDQARLAEGKFRIGFDRETPSRFGVLPRRGTAADVRWFDAEPCYMYHSINAHEEGDEIVLTGCRVKDPIPVKRSAREDIARLDNIELVPELYEWRMNLKTGGVREKQLDDLPTEFPKVNEQGLGKKLRYSFNPRIARRSEAMFDGLVKYDLSNGSKTTWETPTGWYVGEASFAPRPGATAEDDGWLVTFGTNAADQASACFVIDARDMKAGPVAVVHLPQRMPLGFHGTWCAGA
ncbi:MAG: carotenoid oxygenase family protein [Archangiaceae bacterium]|nr:carotenoid oxygenase family protein [Archangiaceae bacterium]